jgi:ubiquinone/menaquinone biosynthesis C-methylase UbiE
MSADRATPHNYWPETKCARAFWGQQELPPYRQLLADTAAWLEPRVGERWLDLGCGCGKLTQVIWEKSHGTVREIVGVDLAGVNAKAFERLREVAQPPAGVDRIVFVHADFQRGLAQFPDEYFDGVVSGLALQYAESFDETRGCWTTQAYEQVLAEVHRVLRPGGSLVFSVNVPRPSFARVAFGSIFGVFRARRFFRYIQKAFRMWRYGRWLCREAAAGRFHYLHSSDVFCRLKKIGYEEMERRRSFAQQAYVIRCRKPQPMAVRRAA